MEDTKRETRCWEPGGQPGLPVCLGESGRGHGSCKARRSRSDGPCLKEGKRRESREESEPKRGGACGPTGSTTGSSSCKEVLAQGSALPTAHSPPHDPTRAAHTSTHHTMQVPWAGVGAKGRRAAAAATARVSPSQPGCVLPPGCSSWGLEQGVPAAVALATAGGQTCRSLLTQVWRLLGPPLFLQLSGSSWGSRQPCGYPGDLPTPSSGAGGWTGQISYPWRGSWSPWAWLAPVSSGPGCCSNGYTGERP